METNYLISYSRLRYKPLEKVLWELRQFGITHEIDYRNNNKTTIEYQDEKFEISYSEELPFEGSCISVKGPKIFGTSYIRKGLIELIELIVMHHYNLEKYETVVLNSHEYNILKKNYFPDVISKRQFFEHKIQAHINLELIQHHIKADDYGRFKANKYSIGRTKTNDQLFALHSITMKGEIEYHASTFLKIDYEEYSNNIELICSKVSVDGLNSFLLEDLRSESKILRIRYSYDQIDGLYYINSNDKFVLIQLGENIGQ